MLRMEDLVTTAEGLDAGCGRIERCGAQRHRVGIVDHPRPRAVLGDGPAKLVIERDGPQRAGDAARTGGVAHRLQDPVALRDDDVGEPHFRRAWLDREHHKIRPLECVRQPPDRPHPESRDRLRASVDAPGHGDVAKRRPVVEVVKVDLPREPRGQGQLGDQVAGPVPAAAADVGDLDVQWFHAKAEVNSARLGGSSVVLPDGQTAIHRPRIGARVYRPG